MKMKMLLIACLLSLPIACAIRKDMPTPFINPTNKPKVDVPEDATNGTKYCAPDANGRFDAATVALEGGLGANAIAWADGGGCVMRPIREVWAALQNMEAMKWDDTDRMTFSRTDHPTADFTHLYAVTYYKSTIIGPIDWTIQWYHGFDVGTFDAPSRINIQYKKVNGTSNIPVWEGGITLSRVKNGVTSIGIHNEFKARQSNGENAQSAKDSIIEITRKARTAAADWEKLNTGFRENPAQPDKPVQGPGGGNTTAGAICVKGRDGRYGSTVDFTLGMANGSAWAKWRGCVNTTAAKLIAAAQNHAAIKWRNAEKVQASVISPSEQSAQYRISRWFRPDIAWTMLWDYTASQVKFEISPQTKEFPVWSGTIQVHEIEPSVTELSLDMDFKNDGDSLSQAKSLAQGLIIDLSNNAR